MRTATHGRDAADGGRSRSWAREPANPSPKPTPDRADVPPAAVAAGVARGGAGLPVRALAPSRRIARQGVPPGGASTVTPPAPGVTTGEGAEAVVPVLKSGDSAVDGRPVADVGAEIHAKAGRYRGAVDSLERLSASSKDDEVKWYSELGLTGGFLDLFNSVDQTDPGRWDAMATVWADTRSAFDAVLGLPATPEAIAEVGKRQETAVQRFRAATDLDQQLRSEFTSYLQGFTQSTGTVVTVTTVVRDISFAAAVGIAVVITAPAVIAGAGAAAAGVGLTGGAATAATAIGTGLTMGGLGAGIEGGLQGTAAVIVETGGFLNDLIVEGKTFEQACAGFSWGTVGAEGWDGMKRGFVDGVLAILGLKIEQALVKGAAAGVAKSAAGVSRGFVGPLLEKALAKAIAGGASGGVVGALDAGLKAAMAGRSMGEVIDAMEMGFALGAGLGAVFGAGGSALEDRAMNRLRQEMAELPELLARDPEAFAKRYNEIVAQMTPEQRAKWDTEMKGRRFVDQEHYGPAKDQFESGTSATPPEHRYGKKAFESWSEAAAMLDEHAKAGTPLTQAELEAAHKAAMAHDPRVPGGTVRDPAGAPGELYGGGGVGYDGLWSKLTPEQIAILEANPRLRLQMRGTANGALSPEELAAGWETAVITYPDSAVVRGNLDEFFAWYGAARGTMNPAELAAEAQRRLVSIHPFLDGNGRVTRLVMDHALQSAGLPPALLRDPNIDYMIAEAAWRAEVQAGVVTAFETTVKHADLFNLAVKLADGQKAAFMWAAILQLTDEPDRLVAWLYPQQEATRPVRP